MPTIPIKLNGQFYESRSLAIAAESTTNMYFEQVPNGSSSEALLSWYGKKSFSSGAGANRGIFHMPWNNHVYMVNGTSLVKVASDGTRTTVGTIAGSDRCVFDASSSYLYIVTAGTVYRTDGSTVSTVSDADLESPDSVAHLNQHLIYDGNGGRFVTSDSGDGSVIQDLNYAVAETYFDDLVRVYVFQQTLYLFGTESVEAWYNSGVGTPPFDRYEGAQRTVGIAGVHAVTNTDQAVYFLGADRFVYRLEGFNPVPVSTVAINNAIASYSDVSDCFAYSLKLQGQTFVVFSFPTANKTWAFSQDTGAWIKLSSGQFGNRDISNGYCYAFGKHLVSDYRNGNLLELDPDTHTDNGDTWIRERITPPVYSGLAAQSGKLVFYNSVKLIVNSGDALASGQGSDPQVMLSYSDDMGRTWSSQLYRSMGALGSYEKEVNWHCLGSSLQRIFKIRFSDPIAFHLIRMEAEVEVGV